MTILGMLLDVASRRGSGIVLRTSALGIYQEMTWDRPGRPRRFHRPRPSRSGVRSGHRVAIVGDPLADWLLCDFAAQCIGGGGVSGSSHVLTQRIRIHASARRAPAF